jgi:hypothetical protein
MFPGGLGVLGSGRVYTNTRSRAPDQNVTLNTPSVMTLVAAALLPESRVRVAEEVSAAPVDVSVVSVSRFPRKQSTTPAVERV